MSDAKAADRPAKVVALVTGASQGLGAVMAKRLARKGCFVIVNYAHSPGKAEAVTEGLTNYFPQTEADAEKLAALIDQD